MQLESKRNQTPRQVQGRKSGVRANCLYLVEDTRLDEFYADVAAAGFRTAKSVTTKSEYSPDSTLLVVKDVTQAEALQVSSNSLAYKFSAKDASQILDPVRRRNCGCRGLPCHERCQCYYCICHPNLNICV